MKQFAAFFSGDSEAGKIVITCVIFFEFFFF